MKLQKSQILYLYSRKYTVINMVEYREDTWIWQEYELVDENHVHEWLTVEENENKQLEYFLYKAYRGSVGTNQLNISIDNIEYDLYEKGVQTVKDYYGNADVDKYETCEYIDYISKDQKNILSVEKWEDEIDITIGYYISPTKINITQEFDKIQSRSNKNNTIWISVGVILLLFVIMFISNFSSLFVNRSITKYIEKQKHTYIYVTSVSNNSNKEKAKVYESKLESVDLTVKDIIDGVPEGIQEILTDSSKSTQTDGIGIQTKEEYAYVYKENGKIYIQISNKKYLNSAGTMYHSRHYNYYYHVFHSGTSSIRYNNYVYSARQRSVNSRVSSGGGTSSGK